MQRSIHSFNAFRNMRALSTAQSFIRRQYIKAFLSIPHLPTPSASRYYSTDPEGLSPEVDNLALEQDMSLPLDYSSWTNEQLVNRVTELEQQLRAQNESFSKQHSRHQKSSEVKFGVQRHSRNNRQFDPSKYNTRYIALKIAYLGQRYNGFEYHANNPTRLPTIEEEIWKALTKTKLIFPETQNFMEWNGCEYSKCGRTDKGVSAFGQVIGIRVRSNRPKHLENGNPEEDSAPSFDPIHDELPYPRFLNRVLPDDIRVLAWCPSPPPGFSARFSCRERRYRYFFTQPAYLPLAGAAGLAQRRHGANERDGWLNIPAMREAAQLFEGAHDFRNFCKLDPARQITNYERTIYLSTVEEWNTLSDMPAFLQDSTFRSRGHDATENTAKVYSFTVHGSAFLWHQIRHMIAILFLVGQGLEEPAIVSRLLDIQQNPCKPLYEMADDAPLVLWDCIFPSDDDVQRKDALEWVYPGGVSSKNPQGTSGYAQSGDGRYGPGGINEVLWATWRRKKVGELLAGSLLDVVAAQQLSSSNDFPASTDLQAIPDLPRSTKVFDGGNAARLKGEYTPVLKRERMESIDVLNARFLERKIEQGAIAAKSAQ